MNLGTRPIRQVAVPALFALAFASAAAAVTPLTPHFDLSTHALVLRRLEQVQVPPVGQNSVVLAITSALGFEPRDTTVNYAEPYPHLPTVDVTAQVRAPDCAFISAVVQGAAAAGYATVRVTGNFCLNGPARWSSSDVAATRSSDR